MITAITLHEKSGQRRSHTVCVRQKSETNAIQRAIRRVYGSGFWLHRDSGVTDAIVGNLAHRTEHGETSLDTRITVHVSRAADPYRTTC